MSIDTQSLPVGAFTPEQKEYLQGFAAGIAASSGLPFVGLTSTGQITASAKEGGVNLAAAPSEDTVFGTPLADLCKPERWKYDENPLDIWEKLVAHAEADQFPDEADTFRFKFHGLFYVAPTQNSFMLRCRIPACELTSVQLHGLAEIAADWGGGYADITTRGNIQIRELKPKNIIHVLVKLQELGLTSRGAGADNVRNITASPNSGVDVQELLDVRPFAKALHHYILNHRDLFGLPRKFNVAFDNGGSISVAADTNDIGFVACRVSESSLAKASLNNPALPKVEPGIYFRLQLGGISGHLDFAKDTGLLIKPSESVAVAAAMIRVFNETGDRTNRKKARLKYVLEKLSVPTFIERTQQKLAFPLIHLPVEACDPRRPVVKHGWIGAYRQPQKGLYYIGAGIPVGRMKPRQMHQLADMAANYGKGELRLTVWQNIIIPNVPEAFVSTVERNLSRIGFFTEAPGATGGIIACTGSKGCKYAAADTKGHALALAKHLNHRQVHVENPVNLHFTGCPHSCAQHYCGDIGFLGAKVTRAGGQMEGYHIVLGGGMDNEQGIAREIFKGVAIDELPALVERILRTYEDKKQTGESFVTWTRRHSVKEIQEMLSE